jgi:DNA polymerase III gamma/tau subunit
MSVIVVHHNITILREHIPTLINTQDPSHNIQNLIENKSPDIHLIGEEESPSSIGIEEVKILTSRLKYKPMQHSKQFGIILHADVLTIQAQNALLKNLEEHPLHTEYILASRNSTNFLATILSRCQIIQIKKKFTDVKTDKIACNFQKQNPTERLIYIEKHNKDFKNRKYVQILIKELISLNRNQTKDPKNLEAVNENLKILNESDRLLKRNTNPRLIIENLAMQLNSY